MAKILYILAGGNGAGKTTYYYQFLKGKGLPFINADEIAKNKYENDPKKDTKAQTEAFSEFDKHIELGESFCYETVFSHNSKIGFIQKAKNAGFRVNLIYVTLETPEIHLERVQKRVLAGGHDVPINKILERLKRIPGLIEQAKEIVDTVLILDNSGSEYKKA